jgi:hypothetical protein
LSFYENMKKILIELGFEKLKQLHSSSKHEFNLSNLRGIRIMIRVIYGKIKFLTNKSVQLCN